MDKKQDEAKSTSTKILQSGKVYRQKFDAEVQLVRALTETEIKRQTREPTVILSKEISHIPLVRDKSLVTGGLLTSRQKTWIEGLPRENYQENPVLYKFYSKLEEENSQDPTETVEVQGLPDVVTPAKIGSDIIDRIAESRKIRHESAVEDMHQDLGVLTANLEPRIVENGESVIAKLEENDKHIEMLMAKLETEEDLMKFTKRELDDIWKEVSQQSTLRQHWIKELDNNFVEIEAERMKGIKEIFLKYAQQLEKISHLMQAELQRLMDHESQMINQTVLSNKRAYADLYARLMMSDIEREKKLHTQWRRRVDEWKKLHTADAVDAFVSVMESDAVLFPPSIELIVEEMKQQQEKLNTERLELLETLLTFKPPASTKSAVYKWNQEVTEISKKIDSLNQEYFSALCKEYQQICQDCLQKVDLMKRDLVERGVCSERRAQYVVNEKCLPLVGARQAAFEKELEQMDKSLEQHNSHILQELRSLFKYCQGAAHVWDMHELGLAKTERALQEKLDECRRKHDNENQDKEANLDILMDRMRQDSSETALQDRLKKALEMLEKIKEGYETFHTDMVGVVGTYPDMVEEELVRYDTTLCKFFSISREHPDVTAARKAKEKEEKPATPSKDKLKIAKSKKKLSPSKSGSNQEEHSIYFSEKDDIIPQTVSEILSTAKGTTFYVLTVAGEHGVQNVSEKTLSSQKVTEDDIETSGSFHAEVSAENSEDSTKLPSYVRYVDIPDKMLVAIKQRIRMNLLDQLEEWFNVAQDRSKSVVSAKTEELNSELDLRFHLHEPRSRRAELDVHNVRAAELVMHSERVSRHCKGVVQSLADLKHKFQQQTLEHNKLAQKFRKDIESMETIFINATKSNRLVILSNQLEEEQENYMEVIRASLRQYRQHLDQSLQTLRESNARFIKSFKVFSDGGNFCPEELDEYRKRLEKMANKIDLTEGFIMSDLEGMEAKRLEQAMKVTKEFEDRFKHHMVDLVFMEKIGRWLTNTQVKIKAEVAESNSQAQELAKYLSALDRRIDACERPNLDKEQITATQLNDSLKSMFEAFHNRAAYLKCVKQGVGKPGEAPPAKVGFTSEVNPLQRHSKQSLEDPSLSVIKNILKTQKNRVGIDTEADDHKEVSIKRKAVSTTTLQVNGDQDTHNDSRDKSKSRMSHRSDAQSLHSKKSGKSSNTETPKRVSSGTTRSMFSKGKGIDKKYFVFGEFNDEGEALHFLGRIQKILREALEGLLAAAELYYRNKGSRQVTRPQALQETFEQCADVLVQKLQSYQKQADEYHNQCLQEFRKQLDRNEDLVYHVPKIVLEELMKLKIEESRREQEKLREQFNQQLSQWTETQNEHKTLLRPNMGHPNEDSSLGELCEEEEKRGQDYLEGVEQYTKRLQECVGVEGQKFIEVLAQKAETLLLQFDHMLTIDDIEKGHIPVKKHPVSELQRRKNAGEALEDPEVKEKLARGKKTWTGIPKNEIVNPNAEMTREQIIKEKASRRTKDGKKKEAPSNLTPSVATQKTTLGHNATVEARDKSYNSYKAQYEISLERIEEQKRVLLTAEQRWSDSWQTSVHNIKQLYL